ncbi:hypothetical protein MC885_015672 [Smutsia gigantea]|nr:hypothetical protein MC885_015672 [Smutsia gigantea]
MFLFSRKTKTPISTYSDSYRAPTSIKEVYKDPPLRAWEANKFVTPGLTQTMQRHVDPEALQKMVKCAMQDYCYRDSIPGHPYLPEKYWLSQEEADKCNPNYLCSDPYNTWKTRPYNCTSWNKCTTYLPRLPKEAGMETVVRGMPLEYPPKLERLNAYGRGRHPWGGCNPVSRHSPCFCLHLFLTLTLSLPIPVTLCLGLPGSGPVGAEREVVVNMLNSLSRNQPQITPRCGCADPLPGRLPFQGYESACSGRRYCLRGMDYCATGLPSTKRRLRPLCAQQPTVRSVSPYEHRPRMQCAVITPPPSYCPSPNLRWDTSHFKKTSDPQRNNYVVYPEFVSETYTDYH